MFGIFAFADSAIRNKIDIEKGEKLALFSNYITKPKIQKHKVYIMYALLFNFLKAVRFTLICEYLFYITYAYVLHHTEQEN